MAASMLVRSGPIPARAGEPDPDGISILGGGAYPRSRGGTVTTPAMASVFQGLSPLARGNLSMRTPEQCRAGPIPARAGEPSGVRSPLTITRAYPRSRGGTGLAQHAARQPWGLSPLARGNPNAIVKQRIAIGPIPARAGEPKAIAPRRRRVRAYPRSRGGTVVTLTPLKPSTGLSPLARGNRGRLYRR